jgi:hypothetical protein
VGSEVSMLIKTVKDAAVSGYAHAYVITRPWKVIVDGKWLVDKTGRPRRFSNEQAAIAAAKRATAR